ncbi:D-2-hydroxyacid dehydrogenase [Streptomyces sp. bgisy154]|uniref:D-2-hydroxyacid dehydrogenase n=1 Tax=Streptomyces sp. bgisy154 TaxID=3413794 RepID=UPI003D71AFA2
MPLEPRAPTVLVLDAEPPPRLGRLIGRARVEHTDADGLTGRLPGADVLLVWDAASRAVRRAWPGGARRPRWVHVAGPDVDHLLCPELIACDTVVTNARGVFEQSVAEYVAALVLAHAKDLARGLTLQRSGEWRHRETRRVAGTRAVVVGSGPVGRAVASALKALGVTPAVVGRLPRTGIHGPDDLDRLLARADWVVAAAPLTEETRGMFDTRRFGVMQPSAYFVNVGRAPLVDEAALVRALTSRWIAGAALDGSTTEPAPGSPLWRTPGLLVSPRVGGAAVGRHDELAAQFVDLYERWAAGRPLRNVVDKRRGYVPGH